MEVWEKYMVTDDFLNDPIHGSRTCISCHGGVDPAESKESAHVGRLADPLEENASLCATCHSNIVDQHYTSLHYTQAGYEDMLLTRSGAIELTVDMSLMLAENCTKCHVTCGQCHVSRPAASEGGFLQGHKFRQPSQTNNCTACHGSRIGEEFKGSREGYQPDTHYLKGMNCFACHSGSELHGDGTSYTHRLDVAELDTCESSGCHPNVPTSNSWHTLHVESVQCQVCHSQAYKNCYECHTGTFLKFPSRIDFRIGLNPIESEKRPWKYVLLRHIPVHPDTFSSYGITLDNFAALPTWKYTAPHNIRKNTPQTATCESCHDNADVFLTPDYIDSLIAEGVMHELEIDANAGVVVTDIP